MAMPLDIPNYINNLVERYKPLPGDEQLSLARKAQQGDQEAKDLLILTNLRFVLQEIRALPTIPIRLEFVDLFDAGVQGMLEALERFDLDSNVNFLTYAYWWIKKRILQTVYGNLSIIHIPRAQIKQLERLYALCERKIQRAMSSPEAQPALSPSQNALEMAQELFGSTDKPVFHRLRCAWNAFDIIDTHSTGNVGSMHLSHSDTHQDEINFMSELERSMHVLSCREEDIVKRHFGIGCRPQSNEEIGLYYSLTTERIRQIVQAALEKIKEELLSSEEKEELRCR
jgi:RNA polymerase primary sigma factor